MLKIDKAIKSTNNDLTKRFVQKLAQNVKFSFAAKLDDQKKSQMLHLDMEKFHSYSLHGENSTRCSLDILDTVSSQYCGKVDLSPIID